MGVGNGFPVNSGDYNRRKVALDSDSTRVYEISCLSNPLAFLSGSSVGGYSFETCLKYCNDNPTLCQFGVAFTNSSAGGYLGSCRFATGLATQNPPSLAIGAMISNSQRFAKLLTAPNYNVNDAIFFQSAVSPGGDLGFCKGPNLNNFNNAFVALQYIDGSYTGDTAQIHQITCGAFSWFTGGTTQNTTAAAQALSLADPTTAEDCARLCNYNYKANGAQRCQTWQMTTDGLCQLNTNRGGGPAPAPTDNPAVTAAGIRIGGYTQTSNVNYRRDIDSDGPAMPQPVGRYHRRAAYGGDSFQDLKPDYIIKGL